MRIFPRGNVLWCRFKHRGTRREHPTDVRIDEPDARRRADEAATLIKAEVIRREGPGGQAAKETVGLDVLEELDMQRAENEGCDPGREKTLEYQWKHLHRLLGGELGEHRDASTITVADVMKYEADRRAEGRPGQTIVRERQALIRGLVEAVNKGMLPALPFDPNLFKPMRRAPRSRARRGILHSDDFIAWNIANLSAKAFKRGHDRMCHFILATGLRASEFARANSFPVTPTEWGAILHVRSSKEVTEETEERDIPLRQAFYEILLELGPKFRTADLDDSLKRASKKLGLERGVTLRDFRVYFGSEAAEHSLPGTQNLLGHSKVSTTATYVKTKRERALATGLAVTGGTVGGTVTTLKRKTPMIRRAMQESNLRPLAPEACDDRSFEGLDDLGLREIELSQPISTVVDGGGGTGRGDNFKRGAS